MSKKLLTAILSLVLLSSCSLFGNNTSDTNGNSNTTPGLVTKEGIIRSKEIFLNTPGTHKLEMQDGNTLLLESKTVALSDYLDQKVVVEGILFIKNNTEVLDVSTVSLDTLNQNQNENASTLLQYSGPLGMIFEYSSLFLISSPNQNEISMTIADQTVEIEKKEVPVITIKIFPTKPDILKKWITDTLKKESVTILVGNKDGERIQNTTTNDAVIYVLTDKLYEISFLSPGGKDEAKIKNKFYEMLNTFVWQTENVNENKNMNSALFNANLNATSQVKNNNQNIAPSASNKNINASVQSSINSNTNHYTAEVQGTPSEKEAVISYLSQHLNDLKPADEEITGNVSATKYEFTTPNYVYVEYTDGTLKRKLLLKYYNDTGSIKTSQIAYFVPGTTTTWTLQTGQNEAANTAREIYDGSGAKQTEISQGMSLYEQKTIKYSLQYPRNWYYGGTTPSETGAIHQVNFSNKPLDTTEEGTTKIEVIVFKGTLSSLGIGNTTVYDGDMVSFYVEKDGKVYKIKAPKSVQETAKTMSQTIASQ